MGYRVMKMGETTVRPILEPVSLKNFHALNDRYGYTLQDSVNNFTPFCTKSYIGYLYFAEDDTLLVVEPMHQRELVSLFKTIIAAPDIPISIILTIMQV
jgi:hypothetical protein